MKITQETREKLEALKSERNRRSKVYGVPRLPQKIDAMYDNACRGNLWAYYLDGDPVRQDPVYRKLEGLEDKTLSIGEMAGFQKVAWHYMGEMRARRMDERTYNSIQRLPSWLLKLLFVIRHETDRKLRIEADESFRYQFREPEKEWLE